MIDPFILWTGIAVLFVLFLMIVLLVWLPTWVPA